MHYVILTLLSTISLAARENRPTVTHSRSDNPIYAKLAVNFKPKNKLNTLKPRDLWDLDIRGNLRTESASVFMVSKGFLTPIGTEGFIIL